MAFSNPRSKGIIALGITDGDRLIDVRVTDGKSDIFWQIQQGFGIRFSETQVRSMGRTATGVTGVKFKDKKTVVGMVVLAENDTILTTKKMDMAKEQILLSTVSSRGGKGVTNIKVTAKNGPVVVVLRKWQIKTM